MRVTPPDRLTRRAHRLRDQGGFTMILALGVLLVTALLSMAIFVAVQGDASLTRTDLSGKRAYAAAQAGLQEYLYELNANSTNSTWWETCTNDMTNGTGTAVAVPGSTYGETYSYTPVLANGATSCSSTNPVGTLIDSTTGTLRIKVTGYTGTSSKTIVASLHTLSPLSFLWYTVHETEDVALGDSSCSIFYWQGNGPPSDCQINWVTGDHLNGPLYTQDQLLIYPGSAPTFGRTGSTDQVISQQSADPSVCASGCQSAVFANTPITNPTQQVPFPSDNSNLLSDATAHGKVFPGTTTLTLSVSGGKTYADGWTCTSSSASSCTQIVHLDMTASQIIYATNASGCVSSYVPTSVSYPTVSGTPTGRYYGPCGDIYLTGTYATPVTIAAANDVIVTDSGVINSTDTTPTGTGTLTGSATLGLVANEYVRVMHSCTGNPAVTIDGAILTLDHSFFVDNYNCGGTPLGTLTVHGSIAQEYRGIVGSVGASGYLKNYNYDDRLGLILPPYLFDLQNTQWAVFRETLCDQTGSTSSAGSCLNPSS
jgi:Tfp pilus assembly protein PilX